MQPEELKKTKTKSPDQALHSLQRLCARAEKCSSDARRLMRGWGLSAADAERVLARLEADRFIDDARYAAAFVREKLRLSGWGTYKIRAALARKGVARELIDEALTQADPADASRRLSEQLERKARTIRHATPRELKNKLIRYGLSLGYPCETVLETAAAIVPHSEPCDDF